MPQLPIEADLPLAIDDPGAAGARCVLRIGPPRDQSAAHRAVDVQDVRSAYECGRAASATRITPPPSWRIAKPRTDAEGRHQVVRVGDPLLDLVGTTVGGLLGTLDRRVREGEVDDAAAELAATPRSHDRPLYRPYSFERVVVRAQKQAVVPVALLDVHGRELRATELRQHERRELFVLHGLDPRDRDYEQHRSSSMTRADLARWARTPPALRLSSVAIALTEGAPAAEKHLAEIAPAAGSAVPGPTSVGPDLELGPTMLRCPRMSPSRGSRTPSRLRRAARPGGRSAGAGAGSRGSGGLDAAARPRAWSRSAPAGPRATASTSATTWS